MIVTAVNDLVLEPIPNSVSSVAD
jgi:hypothetical protein